MIHRMFNYIKRATVQNSIRHLRLFLRAKHSMITQFIIKTTETRPLQQQIIITSLRLYRAFFTTLKLARCNDNNNDPVKVQVIRKKTKNYGCSTVGK